MLGLIHRAVDITVGIGQRKSGLRKQNNIITGGNKTSLKIKMKLMKDYDKQREIELLRKLFLLTAKRSMRPSMTDNVTMRLIFEELHLLTDKDEYKL